MGSDDEDFSIELVAKVDAYNTAMRSSATSAMQAAEAAQRTKVSAAAMSTSVEAAGRRASAAYATIGRNVAVVGGVMAGAFLLSANAAAGFEKSMSGVRAVSGATGAQMKLLSNAALKAGADTVFSATQAADAEAELLKAGISVKDVLGGGLTGALSLAAAGQLSLADAATIAAQAMNVFKLRGKDVGHIADVLAAAANKSAADIQQLGDGLRQGGLVAAQTGLSLEETAGALAAFADRALVGSDAGTALKTMLQRLTPTSQEAAAKMAELGISAYDSQGKFIGLAGFAGNLQTSLAGLTDQQRNAALATMFGSDAVRAAAVMFDIGATGVRKYTKDVNDHGAAARMAAAQMDNLSGDLEQLRGSFETALIKGGSGATGALRLLSQQATSLVNGFSGLPKPVQTTAIALIGVGGAVALVGGASMMAVGKVAAFKTSLSTLGYSAASTERVVTRLGTSMKFLGAAGAAITLGLGLNALMDLATKGANLGQLADDLVTFAQRAKVSGELSRIAGTDLQDLGLKIQRASRNIAAATLDPGNVFGGTSWKDVKQARKDIEGLDQALTALLQAGQADLAAKEFQTFSAAAKSGGASAENLAKAFPKYRDAAASLNAETRLAAGVTGAATASASVYAQKLKDQAEASQSAAKAIRDQSNALKAQFDPLFAVQDALTRQKQAQLDLTDALHKHGRGSKDYATADVAALRATVDIDAAVRQLKASLTDHTTSLGAVNRQLDTYVKSNLISTAQGARYKEMLAQTVRTGDNLYGTMAKNNAQKVALKMDKAPIDRADERARSLLGHLRELDHTAVTADVIVRIGTANAGAIEERSRRFGGASLRAAGALFSSGGTASAADLKAAQARALQTSVERAALADMNASSALDSARSAAVGPNAAAAAAATAQRAAQVRDDAAHTRLKALTSATSAAVLAARDHTRALQAAAAAASLHASQMPSHTKAQQAAKNAAQDHARTLSFQASEASRAATAVSQHNAVAIKAARDQVAAADKALSAAKAAASATASAAKDANQAVTDAATAAVEAHTALADAVYADSVAKAQEFAGDISKQLDVLVAKADTMRSAFSSAVTSGSSLGDLFKAQDGTGVQNVATVIASLQDRLTASRSFASELSQLQGAGLSDDLLNQISGAGLQTGSQIAQSILAAGPEAIASLNDLSSQLADVAATALDPMVAALYGAAADAALAVVNGLYSQFPAIEDAIAEINAKVQQVSGSVPRATGGSQNIPSPTPSGSGAVTIIVQPAPTTVTLDGKVIAENSQQHLLRKKTISGSLGLS